MQCGSQPACHAATAPVLIGGLETFKLGRAGRHVVVDLKASQRTGTCPFYQVIGLHVAVPVLQKAKDL